MTNLAPQSAAITPTREISVESSQNQMQRTRYSSLHSLPNQMEFTRISFSHRFHQFSPSNHSLGNSNNFFAIDVFGEKKILQSNSSASILKSDFHSKLDNQNLGSRKDDIASGGNPSFVAKGGVSNRAVIEHAEYFEADVLVHLANAPQYSLFNWLGDIMPQMCEEARPSLDLSAAKQSEVYNNSSKSSFNLKENETRFQQGSDTEAENMFIKSLIFRKILKGINDGGPLEKFGLFEDTPGYFGNSNSVMSDNRDKLCRLTKRIQAERQDPQPLNLLQYQHWSQIKHQRPISCGLTTEVEVYHEALFVALPGDNIGFNMKNVVVKDLKGGYVVSISKEERAKGVADSISQVIIMTHPGQIGTELAYHLTPHEKDLMSQLNVEIAELNEKLKTRREVQASLVETRGKDTSIIGSGECNDAIELSFVLDKVLGVSYKVKDVRCSVVLITDPLKLFSGTVDLRTFQLGSSFDHSNMISGEYKAALPQEIFLRGILVDSSPKFATQTENVIDINR
ncbi:hypothetical protein L1887_08663 [Cichorium endivia]|nr:hypothetical protein L1887_08663 [Cichorium endivia]